MDSFDNGDIDGVVMSNKKRIRARRYRKPGFYEWLIDSEPGVSGPNCFRMFSQNPFSVTRNVMATLLVNLI